MDAIDPVAGGAGSGLPELCDLCGVTIADGLEVLAFVPDSSALSAEAGPGDGQRLLTACSREHLAELVEEYRQRPFVEEEQWAAQIERALEQYGDSLSAGDVAAVTGLAPHQIDRALAWFNTRVRRWEGQCDHGDA